MRGIWSESRPQKSREHTTYENHKVNCAQNHAEETKQIEQGLVLSSHLQVQNTQ